MSPWKTIGKRQDVERNQLLFSYHSPPKMNCVGVGVGLVPHLEPIIRNKNSLFHASSILLGKSPGPHYVKTLLKNQL